MDREALFSIYKHIITQTHGVPAEDADLEKVAILMHSLREGTPPFRRLDFKSVEVAGILQIKEK